MPRRALDLSLGNEQLDRPTETVTRWGHLLNLLCLCRRSPCTTCVLARKRYMRLGKHNATQRRRVFPKNPLIFQVERKGGKLRRRLFPSLWLYTWVNLAGDSRETFRCASYKKKVGNGWAIEFKDDRCYYSLLYCFWSLVHNFFIANRISKVKVTWVAMYVKSNY